MHPSKPRARIHGLDTLRALALTLVVLHHYVLFVSGQDTFGWLGEVGWVGVDLFFALSGYLIGGQIFKALRGPDGFSLGRFYARRLLRTLPNFWAVLALYALVPAFRGEHAMLPLWKYLSFTQNVQLRPGTAFSHAWSLCIEEQFYLLLPACALLGTLFVRTREDGRASMRGAWALLALTVVFGMAVRATVWQQGGGPQGPLGEGWQRYYFQHIYYSTICRFDELLAGVGLAMLEHRHGAAWRRILGHGRALLVAGIALSLSACGWFLHDRYAFAVNVFGFPLLALGCAFLILAALAPASPLHRMRVPGAASLALWSYAIYLVHKQVGILAARPLKVAGYGAEHPLTIALALGLSVLAGWLLYRIVETPFMRLRERFVPSNSALPAQGPASMTS